ncbi:MAG: cobalamin-dependent protein [Gammaproteobacteria bacterium]|nr:cobalamin-dependent protein [Gammaproteobacteria bacterium]
MNQTNKVEAFAAEILDRGASGFAAAAALRLLDDRPEIEERYSPSAMDAWKSHLTQRVNELSAAVAVGSSAMFVNRVIWSRRIFDARDFKREDLEASLAALHAVLEDKLPANAQDSALRFISDARTAMATQLEEDDSLLDAGQAHGRLALQYLHCAIEGNVLPAMEVVLDQLGAGTLSAEDAMLSVLLPAQAEIGRLWHLGELSVAEEHLVTTTTNRLMAVIANRADRRRDNGKTAVACSVAGNVHDVGIQAIAYLLELEGWRSIYLGANVPAGDLPATLKFFEADVVLLSCALSVHLKNLRKTIAIIRDESKKVPKILVGGLAFFEAPELWKEIGADGYALDAKGALESARDLVDL